MLDLTSTELKMKQIVIAEWTSCGWQAIPEIAWTQEDARAIIEPKATAAWEDAVGWKWESRATIVDTWDSDWCDCAVINRETGEVWAAWKCCEIDVPNID
jgi:hypothetical protein